jgi:putative tricarboxylic transport membrane protein
MGALTMYNITPGPQLFAEQPTLVWALIASLMVGNIILLLLNLPLVGFFARLLSIPSYILIPMIATVSFVGVYAIHSTIFDLLLCMGLGIIGYILRKFDFPLAPLILGFVLGELMESNLRRALSISQGELSILWSSGISMALWVMSALLLILPFIRKYLWVKKKQA